jgi:cyclopropane-fatty-acyl-phospholipid synthase
LFGDGTGEEVRIRFMDTAAERALGLNAEVYAGELFMDGRLGTIFDFLALVLRDPAPLSLGPTPQNPCSQQPSRS